MNVAVTKMLIYYIWSQTHQTENIRKTIELLYINNLLKKKDTDYFENLLNEYENKKYDNRDKADAINHILWERFNREKSYIQSSPLEQRLKRTSSVLKNIIQK